MKFATHTPRHMASFGLAAVLLCLTVFALWSGAATHAAVDQVRDSRTVSNAFERARSAVATEESLQRDYRLEPARGVRTRFDAAARSFVQALREARRALAETGRPRDAEALRTVDRTLAQHRRYVQSVARLFAADDAGSTNRATAIDNAEVDPLFSRMQAAVGAEAEARSAESASRLSDLEDHQAWVRVATPIAFALGLGLLGAFAAILVAHRRRAEEAAGAEMRRLEHAALTDSLTGLPNRRAFQENIASDIERRERQQTPLSLVIVDVDDLKVVNDTGGHDAGDRQLKAVAAALRDTAQGAGAVYRLGGDEFAVVLTAEHALGAFRFAQRLRQRLGREVAGPPVSVTAGIAEAEGLAEMDTLVRHADLALIEAKRSEHSALIYTPELEPQVDAYDASQHSLMTLASALARAVDAKDDTRGHCETVAELCAQIAAQLGLGDERIAKVRLAGLLHDVGKIGIKNAILQKPAKLTDEEYGVMKTHASLGHRIVSGANLDEEAVWILHHHEHLDGCGYPHGLSEDAIPLESRIILVADAFEAITADRVYRKARSDGEALTELERNAGTQFDPACVAALARALGHDAPLVEGEGQSGIQMVT